jgi:copper resistance protein D
VNVDAVWLVQVALAAIADIAFACTTGAMLLNAWLIDERAVVAPGFGARMRAQRLAVCSACVLALSDLVLLWLQAVSMSGESWFDALPAVLTVVTSTHAGRGWVIAFGGSVVLLIAATSRARAPGRWLSTFGAFGAIVAAAGKASIGHAADGGAFSLAEWVQGAHVLGTALWGGVVIAGALGVVPALRTSASRALLVRIVGKLSVVSTIAVIVVIATGVFNAWRGIGGSLHVLEASGWGHVLAVKLVFVATAFGLGAINRVSAFPRLKRTAATVDARTVTGVMQVEAWLMIAVFVAASVLSHSVPGFA